MTGRRTSGAARGTTRSWGVVAVAFLGLFLNYGLRNAFGLFLKPVASDLGGGRGMISAAMTISMLVYGFASPLVGLAAERIPPRRVLALGAVLVGVALVASSVAVNPVHFILAYGLFFGLGSAGIGQVPASTLVIREFQTQRGAALGLMGAGGGLGALVLNPLAGYLVEALTWRRALVFLGVISWTVLLVPVALLGTVSRQGTDTGQGTRGVLAGGRTLTGGGAGGLLTAAPFWGLCGALFFLSFSIYIVLTHGAAFATDAGIPVPAAAAAMGFVTGAGIVGGPPVGWLGDRLGDRRYAGMVANGCGLVGMALLLWLPPWGRTGLLFAGSGLIGPAYAGYVPTLPDLADKFFESRAGSVWGLITLTGALRAALGSWVGGILYDLTGGYQSAMYAGTVGLLLSTACLIVLGVRARGRGHRYEG